MPRAVASVVYVLSNPRIPDEYKVGIHSGTLGKLYSRYSTTITDVEIHLVIENVAAKLIEEKLHERRGKYRIPKKHSGRLSEWFNLSLETIILDLMMILMSGKKYGLDGKKKVAITELKERREKKIRIISPRLESESESESSKEGSTSSEESSETSRSSKEGSTSSEESS